MGFTKFPHGISSIAGPLIGDGARFSTPFATHYFVDGTDGLDSNDGKEPTKAFKTIQKAMDVAQRQDVVYVRGQKYVVGTGYTRYTEDVSITMDYSGTTVLNDNMSIIGVGSNCFNGDYSGVRWKHASATNLTNEAPGLHLENIGFFSEGATYGILLSNNGATNTQRGTDGFSMYHCAMKGKGLYVLSGGDGISIDSCRFQCAYDGTVAQLNVSCSANPGRRLTVRNCEWLDGNGTAPSGPCINIAGVMSELLIRDCYFPQDPTGNVYITITSSTGSIANCHFACADVSTGRIVEGGVICTGIYDGGGLATAT